MNPLRTRMSRVMAIGLLLGALQAWGTQQPRKMIIQQALTDSNRDHIADREGETVVLEGVLTTGFSLADEAGDHTAYMQDRSAGIRLRIPGRFLKASALEQGDRVAVNGTITPRNGRTEIAVGTISLVRQENAPVPRATTAAEVASGSHLGMLVRLHGELARFRSATLPLAEYFLEDDSGKAPIFLPSVLTRDLDLLSRLRSGRELTLTGIVEYREADEGEPAAYYIRPREAGDFRFVPEFPAATFGLWFAALALAGSFLYLFVRRRYAEQRAAEVASYSETLKRSEEALRESNLRLTTVLECSPIAIVVHDAEGNVQLWNPAAEALFGWTGKEVLGKPNPTIPPEQMEQHRERRASLLEGHAFRLTESQRCCKNGKCIAVVCSGAPLRRSDGSLLGTITSYVDLTDRKLLEAQLLQAQKMEAIGRLAGGVAHDFNNMLNVIAGYSELIEARLQGQESLTRYVGEIRKAAKRAADLTRQLLAFSRKQTAQPRVLDLNELIAESGQMLRRLIGEHIELTTLCASGLGRIKADPSHVEQVIWNLVVNARDATPGGGRLTIETANVKVDEDFASRHRGLRPGRYVLLSVRDTGIGMDVSTQEHIFEPFFTTKPVGQGTGLGLSTVYGVVKQNEGYIAVHSEVGKGTTFEVYLPEWHQREAPQDRPKLEKPGPQGSETILLVEDEPGVRQLARAFLESGGYRVLEVSNGAGAVELARRYPAPIHLVLTDVIMPQMSGPALIAKLADVRPEAKALYMSGYTDDIIAPHGVLDPTTILAQKPFSRNTLLLKVRQALDGTAPRTRSLLKTELMDL